MKAGAFTPATLGYQRCRQAPSLHRSMKAGAFTPATPVRRTAHLRVYPCRSMKAGAFTPATPDSDYAEGNTDGNAQ